MTVYAGGKFHMMNNCFFKLRYEVGYFQGSSTYELLYTS